MKDIILIVASTVFTLQLMAQSRQCSNYNADLGDKYVSSFSPSNDSISFLPSPDSSISCAFVDLYNNRPIQFNKLMCLCILKLYYSHLECCQQSYELESSSESSSNLVILIDLINRRFSGQTSPLTENYISSEITYNWLKTNKRYLLSRKIRKIYRLINRKLHEIEQIN
jgi:hypothetical protein